MSKSLTPKQAAFVAEYLLDLNAAAAARRAALSDRPDLHEPLNTLCRQSRRDQPFHARPNRHGNPTLRPNPTTTLEERTAILLIAAASEIVIVDEIDYWDWLTTDFNAQAVLDLLKEAT